MSARNKETHIGANIPAPYRIIQGASKSPLIYDSPHSGLTIPEDFNFDCSLEAIHRCADIGVNEIIEGATTHNVDILMAEFPRCYIDLNRAPNCYTEEQFKGGLSEKFQASNEYRAKGGTGLIWMRSMNREISSLYNKAANQPTEADLAHRLQHYYDPYHAKLTDMLQDRKQQFGHAYHIDWHCCYRTGFSVYRQKTERRADFVISNEDGKTSSPTFIRAIQLYFQRQGYSTAINDPFKGDEMITRNGNPKENIHSVQIEIVRDLYLDEDTLTPHAGIKDLQKTLVGLTQHLQEFIALKPAAAPAPSCPASSARKKMRKPSPTLKTNLRP